MLEITIIRKKNNIFKRIKTKEKCTYTLIFCDGDIEYTEIYDNLNNLFNRLTQEPINLDTRPIMLYEKE